MMEVLHILGTHILRIILPLLEQKKYNTAVLPFVICMHTTHTPLLVYRVSILCSFRMIRYDMYHHCCV